MTLAPLLVGAPLVGFKEQLAEWHLVGHGCGNQSGHGRVSGAAFQARHVLGMQPHEFCRILLREAPRFAKFAESCPKQPEFPLDGRRQVLPGPDFGTSMGMG
jgi:hypothetical protein